MSRHINFDEAKRLMLKGFLVSCDAGKYDFYSITDNIVYGIVCGSGSESKVRITQELRKANWYALL